MSYPLIVTNNIPQITKEISRKMRSEVAKLYIANTAHDVQWLIDKYNANPDIPGIECVIADADLSAVKILDSINKRSNGSKTRHLPIISTLLLVPPTIDSETILKIKEVGGANVMLRHPGALSAEIFTRVLETMYKMKNIERTYKDLSTNSKMITFPYIPIFHNNLDVDNDGEADYGLALQNGEGRFGDTGEEDDDDEEIFSLEKDHMEAGSVSSWTYASSMLPAFVKERRNINFEDEKLPEENATEWRRLPDLKTRHRLDQEAHFDEGEHSKHLTSHEPDETVEDGSNRSQLIVKTQDELSESESMVLSLDSKGVESDAFFPSHATRKKKDGLKLISSAKKNKELSLLDLSFRPHDVKSNKKSSTLNFDPTLLPFLHSHKIDLSNTFTIGGNRAKIMRLYVY